MPGLWTTDAIEALLARWLQVVASRGADPQLDELLAEGVTIERHHWSPPGLAQVIQGRDAARAWLARSPATVQWTLESPGTADDEGWLQVRYGVRVVDFVNGGWWRLRVEDGRVTQVEHRPDDLPNEWKQGLPEGKRLE